MTFTCCQRHDRQMWSTESDHPKLLTVVAAVCLPHWVRRILSYYYGLLLSLAYLCVHTVNFVRCSTVLKTLLFQVFFFSGTQNTSVSWLCYTQHLLWLMNCILLSSWSGLYWYIANMLCFRQKQRQDFSNKQRRHTQCFLVKRKRSNGTNMVNSSSKLVFTQLLIPVIETFARGLCIFFVKQNNGTINIYT